MGRSVVVQKLLEVPGENAVDVNFADKKVILIIDEFVASLLRACVCLAFA